MCRVAAATGYSSVVKSEPLGLLVRITLKMDGRIAPVTSSISFTVSGRAPLRMSTRLLFDMSFLLFSLAFSQSGQAQPIEALELRCGSYESISVSGLLIVLVPVKLARVNRSEEHTSELQSH